MLVILLSTNGCSNNQRSHLFVHVCNDYFIIDNVKNNELLVLLKNKNKNWGAIQILFNEGISPERIAQAKSDISHIYSTDPIYVNKTTKNECI